MISKEININFEKKICELLYEDIFPVDELEIFRDLEYRFKYRFFKSDEKKKKKVINQLSSLSLIEIFKDYSLHKIGSKRVFILYNENSIENIIKDLKEEFKNDYTMTLDLEIYKYNYDRNEFLKSSNISKYEKYIKKTPVGFDIIMDIIPKIAIFGINPKIYEIPNDLKKPFNKLSIIVSPKGKLSSVKLSGKMSHPNCDANGYYCLGTLTESTINNKTLDILIENIKVFNLNNCYYVPDELLKIIKGDYE